MLTQLELLNTSGSGGNDEDSGMSLSTLDGLSEYPIEQTEFEYFESNLGSDSYYDVSPAPDVQDSSLPPPPSLTPTTTTNTQIRISNSLYESALSSTASNSILSDSNDIKPFSEDIKPFSESYKPLSEVLDSSSSQDFNSNLYDGSMKFNEVKLEMEFEGEEATYDAFSSDVYDTSMTQADFNLGSLCNTFDANLHANEPTGTKPTWDEGAGKGKIGPLQRRALDSIFSVTEKPSRGLVLHIASELGLHHITVKNFFSNGRRRLRRAAARLSDPERTRRENERRKEKRRLAARASAALVNGENKGSNSTGGSPNNNNNNNNNNTKLLLPTTVESPPPKETTIVSLERRALMEKLADKVQRSKAQRSINEMEMLQSTNATSQDFLSQPTQDLLINPTNDILSQASQDILSHPSHGLLSELPHDFLAEPSQDLGQTTGSSSLLNPNTDPWNFF